MPAQVKVILSEEDQKRLTKNIRSRTTPTRLVERSKIVLLASQGKPNYKIAEELSIDANKVGRWRNRFVEKGFPGIEKDLPRGANHGGKNSKEQAETSLQDHPNHDTGKTRRSHTLVDTKFSPQAEVSTILL